MTQIKIVSHNHNDRSCASCIPRIPATISRSSNYLVGGLSTLGLPVCSRHSRSLLPYRPSILRAIYRAHCLLSLVILRAMFFTFALLLSLTSDLISQGNSEHSPLFCPLSDLEPSYKAHSKQPRLSIVIYDATHWS